MAKIGGRLLKLQIDGTEYRDQVTKAVITSGEGDSDTVTFFDAEAGGARDYKLVLTVTQDLAAGTLYREIIDNPGDTVPFTIAPYGNAVATAAEPHVEGNAVISEPDGDFIGGEADKSPTKKLTIDVEWSMPSRFTLVSA